MATLPLQCADATLPHVAVARRLLNHYRAGEHIDRSLLRRLFEEETGASDASGAWTMRQAYDAIELAQTLFVSEPGCPLLAGSPRDVLAALESFADRLPVQSYRSEAQVELQQFSTPLPLAWLAGLAATPSKGEVVLEPSAGNGLLVWPTIRAGCRLFLNEIDADRRAGLVEALPGASLSGHDGELIDDLLGPACRPSLVLMNPPFGRSAGRGADRYAAGRHLGAALSQWKLGAPVAMDEGILFVTYPTLRSGRADATRLRQILDWAGAEYAGVIAFDEAHAMANAAGGEGSRGKVKGSEQGIAGIRLQNLLPRARVLYASATGASDVNNLAYAMRLGLWGPETPSRTARSSSAPFARATSPRWSWSPAT